MVMPEIEEEEKDLGLSINSLMLGIIIIIYFTIYFIIIINIVHQLPHAR